MSLPNLGEYVTPPGFCVSRLIHGYYNNTIPSGFMVPWETNIFKPRRGDKILEDK